MMSNRFIVLRIGSQCGRLVCCYSKKLSLSQPARSLQGWVLKSAELMSIDDSCVGLMASYETQHISD